MKFIGLRNEITRGDATRRSCHRIDHKIDRRLDKQFLSIEHTHVLNAGADEQNAGRKIIEPMSAQNQAIEAAGTARNEYPSIVVSQPTPLLCSL